MKIKTNFVIFLTLTLLIQMISFSTAVSSSQDIFELTQPDGTVFSAKQIGDERASWFETLDEYTIIQDKDSWWTYAEKSKSKKLVSTDKKVLKFIPNEKNTQKKIKPKKKEMSSFRQTPVPSMKSNISTTKTNSLKMSSPNYTIMAGTEKILVIPIKFIDKEPNVSHTPNYFNNLIFDTTPSTNSMRNYFQENTYNNLEITGNSINWVTSSHTMAYYGADENGAKDTGETGRPVNIYELAREAVQLANASGVNFADYDTNGDGFVDHVLIIHAGGAQEKTSVLNDIWSHKWWISPFNGELVDGKYVFDYTMVSENSSVGVFAHEFAHDLGAPDLYDTDNTIRGIPVYDWGLMGHGNWNGNPPLSGNSPAHISGYLKWDIDANPNNGITGWLTPTTITTNQTININELANNSSNSVFKIDIDNNEYFIIENRQKTKYDSYLPESGLLFWHIDKRMPNNNGTPTNLYYKALVEDPSQTTYLHNAAYSSNDGQTSFTWQTTPNTCSNSCATINASQKAISFNSIGSESSTMAVTVSFTTPTSLNLSTISPLPSFTTTQRTPLLVRATVKNNLNWKIQAANVTASFNNGDSQIILYDDGSHNDGASTDGTYANNWFPSNTGEVTITITASDSQLTNGTANISGTITTVENILLVDDDGGQSYETYFKNALTAGKYKYNTWDINTIGSSPPAKTLLSYNTVIWSTSKEYINTLTPTDQSNLSEFLNKGGNLFLSGQDIGYDINNTNFYTNYLHATLNNDGLGNPTVVGVTNESISNGITTTLTNSFYNTDLYPSEISATDGFASPLFKYNSQTGAVGALKITKSPYKIIYLAFSFETMADIVDQNLLMNNAMQWFTTPNNAPTMDGVSESSNPVKGGGLVTITASNSADTDFDILSMYCATTSPATQTNTDFCSDTANTSPYSNVSCIGNASVGDSLNLIYCRLFDGTSYSTEYIAFFESDSTPPTTTIVSVAGDTTIPYVDTTNDSLTNIIINGESEMACRFTTTDQVYSSINPLNECNINGSQATCSLENLTQTNYTYYISCKDSLGNEQTTAQNKNISFNVLYNIDPVLNSINPTGQTLKGGQELILTANTTDTENSTLDLYCATSSPATQTNTDFCSDIGNTSPYGNVSCTGIVKTDDKNHSIYCRTYDRISYSNEIISTYTSDSTPPTTTIVSVAGDTIEPYKDEIDESLTDIIISGESNMLCRFNTIDEKYSLIDSGNECDINKTQATCHLGNLPEANYTYYISCKDAVENQQTTVQNKDISFEVVFNPIPQLTSLLINPLLAKGNSNILIDVNATDSNLDSLSLYCTTTSPASQANSDFCSDTANTAPYSNMSCIGTALSDDSNHTIHCIVSDGINNSIEQSTSYTSDSTLPKLNTIPVSEYSKSTITINSTAIDANMDKLTLFKLNVPETILDSNSTPIGNNYSLDLNTTMFSDGNTSFIVQALDTVKNTTEFQFWTIIDNTTPAIENISGTDGFISGSKTEKFSISIIEANLNKSTVKIFWNNAIGNPFTDVNATCTGTTPNYTCSINLDLTNFSENTQITYYGTATDLANTNNTSTKSTVTIDRTPPIVNTPTVNNYCIANNVVYVPENFKISTTASDNNSTISCEYSLNNGINWNNNSTSYSTGNCISNITNQTNGTEISIKTKATDSANNQTISPDFNATIDGVGPTITDISVTYPNNGTVVKKDESIIVKATIFKTTNNINKSSNGEPPCNISTVVLNATNIGDSATLIMNDSGTNGDEIAGDNIYSTTATASSITKTQTVNLTINAVDSLSNTSNSNANISVYKISNKNNNNSKKNNNNSKKSNNNSKGHGNIGGGAGGSTIKDVTYFEFIKLPDRKELSLTENNDLNFSITNIKGMSLKGLTIKINSKTCKDCFSFELTNHPTKQYLPYIPIKIPVKLSIKKGTPPGEYQIKIHMEVDVGQIKQADTRTITIIVPEKKSQRKNPFIEREIYINKKYVTNQYGYKKLYIYPKIEIKLNVKNGPNTIEHLKIIETIPKEILEDINDTFIELRKNGNVEQPYFSSEHSFKIINSDPIIEFDLGSAKPFEEKTISYSIKKERIDVNLYKNLPKITYTTIGTPLDNTAICGDGNCTSPDENPINCPQDCKTIKKQPLVVQTKNKPTSQCKNQTCDEEKSIENCSEDCQTTQTNNTFYFKILINLVIIGIFTIIFISAIVFIKKKQKKQPLVVQTKNKKTNFKSVNEKK